MRQELGGFFFAKNSQKVAKMAKKITEIMKKKWRWDKFFFLHSRD